MSSETDRERIETLVAKWRVREQALCRRADALTGMFAERLAYRADGIGGCADELEALLSPPVSGEPPADAREIRRRTGVELDNHHNALVCPYCNPDRLPLCTDPSAHRAVSGEQAAQLQEIEARRLASNPKAEHLSAPLAATREEGSK